MNVIYTATDSTGKTYVRTSAKAVYTHAVVGRHDIDRDIATVKDRAKWDRQTFDENKQIADGNDPHPLINPREGDAAAEAFYIEMNRKRRRRAADVIMGCQTADAYIEMQRRRKLKAIARKRALGYYDETVFMGWRKSLDAALALAKQSKKFYCRIEVLEVQSAPEVPRATTPAKTLAILRGKLEGMRREIIEHEGDTTQFQKGKISGLGYAVQMVDEMGRQA